MPENYFILCSTTGEDCTPVYWSKEEGWTPEEERATHYDKSVLCFGTSPPEEIGAVLEKSPEGKDVRFYAVVNIPFPMGVLPWFEAIECP